MIGRRRWLVLVVLCTSTLVLVGDTMVLNVAIPSLMRDLNATPQDIQWIVDSYILVFAGLVPIAGSLSDRFGRRRAMVLGLVILGVASLAAAFARTPPQVTLGRVGMAVGAALVLPSTLSMLVTVFTDAKERRTALTAWSAMAVIGLFGGPVVGGALIARFWWGAAFLINVPVAVVGIVAAVVSMPESTGRWRRPDPVGAGLSVVGMTAVVWAIVEVPRNGIAHPGTLVAGAVGVASLTGFVVWEMRSEAPMVPMSLFRDRDFAGASLALVLLSVANGGMLLVLTQYLQFVHGYGPTRAGLAFLPVVAMSLLFDAIGARPRTRTGNRATVAAGMLVFAAGLGVLGTVDAADGYWPVGIALAMVGAGCGLAIPAAVTTLMGAVPAEHVGVGSAVNDTLQQAGAALGVAALGSVLAGAYTGNLPAGAAEPVSAREAFADGVALACTVGACVVAVAAVVATVVMRDRTPAAVHPRPAPAPADGRELAGAKA
jgi:EmrB/QacA subfamily drug resistance transporter